MTSDAGHHVPGTICLQGGREFGSSCRDLDLEVLRRTPLGPVVVLAGAAAPGKPYATASRNAARYYGNLGGDTAVAAPDPREDLADCLEVLGQAELVVLPGGSPTELLRVLTEVGDGAVGEALVARHAAGATISGASAGAMVLCARTWLADTSRAVVDGLGLLPGLAMPHWSEDSHARIPTDAPPVVWGLPECGGLLHEDGTVVAAGSGTPVLVHDREVRELPRSTPLQL